MKIIGHRGKWKSKASQNSLSACNDGCEKLDGIEIDLKNKNGAIILSHDPILAEKKYTDLASIFSSYPLSFYALNIKEDGLAPKLLDLIRKYGIKNYMCFDLSTPERIQYKKLKLNTFDRYGDQDFWNEANLKSKGLVIDIFNSKNDQNILSHLNDKKLSLPLFFISPELHGRNHLPFWKLLKALPTTVQKKALLCTDYPDQAMEYFNE